MSESKDTQEEQKNTPNKKDTSKLIAFGILRFVGLLGCLYFFVVSLDLMSSGFRLLAERQASF